MKPDPYREYRDITDPVRAPDPSWTRALANPLSLAAEGAEHDLARAPHRPGGRIKPRPRFARDERNKAGRFD